MGPSLDAQIALIAIAPFIAGLLAPLVHRVSAGLTGWLLALVPALIFVALLRMAPVVIGTSAISASLPWIPSENIALSFRLDGLSLVFGLTISGIGTFILLFSGAYLAKHQHLGRFFGFLLAFMGAMLGLVLADSLLVLFGFWELTAVTSFLLIGFDHARQTARRAAIQALIVTNIGGLALLVGSIVLRQIGGNWEMSSLSNIATNPAYPLVLTAMVLAAFTKSAQVPFHFWLPNAMEAPTPVSAFLHSATMVQAGVYLLARLTPVLGGTPAWTTILTIVGGVTLLWGAAAALRQTDLKQMLAQTTIASLGLLVLLIGIGSEAAIAAVMVYFVAHAVYKAELFMLVGTIDHSTGTRDITAVGGLMRKMPLSFAAAVLGGMGMLGLPLTLGYLAKEEMYLAVEHADWVSIATLAVLVAGNGALGAIALAVVIRPFTGAMRSTPVAPHEGSAGLLAGPLVLGVCGVLMALATDWFGRSVLEPGASAVLGHAVTSHMSLVPDFEGLVPFLSVLTWAVAALMFMQLSTLRSMLRRLENRLPSLDRLFDVLMFGLIRFAGSVTRTLHSGRLDRYLLVLFVAVAAAAAVPLLHGLPNGFALAPLLVAIQGVQPHEWLVLALTIAGLICLLVSTNRLAAILSLGVQGVGTALIFLLFGAPDLAFTQFMVEILSVTILALVMARLNLAESDRRPGWARLRDGAVALACGVAVSLLLGRIIAQPFDDKLGQFFASTSLPLAHGRNIVNVILVDYRGLDTLGEISVVLGAGLAISALLRRNRRPAA